MRVYPIINSLQLYKTRPFKVSLLCITPRSLKFLESTISSRARLTSLVSLFKLQTNRIESVCTPNSKLNLKGLPTSLPQKSSPSIVLISILKWHLLPTRQASLTIRSSQPTSTSSCPKKYQMFTTLSASSSSTLGRLTQLSLSTLAALLSRTSGNTTTTVVISIALQRMQLLL